jgi:RNA polymerase sigma-70 factor (ECF subfamily)
MSENLDASRGAATSPAPRAPAQLTPEEAALIERIRAGEPQAYEVLVRRHAGRMLAVAQRLLRNADDAHDAVQEAFISAYRHAGSFAGGSSLGTWLHRIVVNAALMKLRSRSRRPEESIDELLPRFHDDGHMIDPAGRWSTAEEHGRLERDERCALVRECIGRLPETYRTVLMLRDIEELDPQETALMLGTSVNAVNIRLHRARQALRALLDPHMRDGVAS